MPDKCKRWWEKNQHGRKTICQPLASKVEHLIVLIWVNIRTGGADNILDWLLVWIGEPRCLYEGELRDFTQHLQTTQGCDSSPGPWGGLLLGGGRRLSASAQCVRQQQVWGHLPTAHKEPFTLPPRSPERSLSEAKWQLPNHKKPEPFGCQPNVWKNLHIPSVVLHS